MLTSNAELMRQARAALKGKWGLAVVENLLFVIIFFAISLIPWIGSVVQLVLFGPLFMGLAIFSLSLSRREEVRVSQIFDGFKRFTDSLIAFLVVNLGLIIWSLVTIVPLLLSTLAIVGLSLPFLQDYQRLLGGYLAASMLLIWAFFLWFLANFVLQLFVMLSFPLTFYLLADQPELGGFEALQQSFRMMKGRRWKVCGLFLRFTGWFLLGSIPLGLGVLWVLPYLQTSMARFYDDLKENDGSAAATSTRPQPSIPTKPISKPAPPQASRAAATTPAPEPPGPPVHPRSRLCLSCHRPITDPTAQACPECGFPLVEAPGAPRKPEPPASPPPPTPSPPLEGKVPPPRPPEAASATPSRPPQPMDLGATVMIGLPRLTSLSPEGRTETFNLRLPVVKIGRKSDNDLAFPLEKTISGRHCEIFREGVEYFIKDLSSTNGVLVNGQKVEVSSLKEGDSIKLGNKIFQFTNK